MAIIEQGHDNQDHEKPEPVETGRPFYDDPSKHEHFLQYLEAISQLHEDLGDDMERRGLLTAAHMIIDIALDTCSDNPSHVPIIGGYLRDLHDIDLRRMARRSARADEDDLDDCQEVSSSRHGVGSDG